MVSSVCFRIKIAMVKTVKSKEYCEGGNESEGDKNAQKNTSVNDKIDQIKAKTPSKVTSVRPTVNVTEIILQQNIELTKLLKDELETYKRKTTEQKAKIRELQKNLQTREDQPEVNKEVVALKGAIERVNKELQEKEEVLKSKATFIQQQNLRIADLTKENEELKERLKVDEVIIDAGSLITDSDAEKTKVVEKVLEVDHRESKTHELKKDNTTKRHIYDPVETSRKHRRERSPSRHYRRSSFDSDERLVDFLRERNIPFVPPPRLPRWAPVSKYNRRSMVRSFTNYKTRRF